MTTTTRLHAVGLALALALCCDLSAQTEAAPKPTFDDANASVQQQLRDAVAEFEQLMAAIGEEKIPLAADLNRLEGELSGVRADYQQVTRLLETRTLDLTNLTREIKSREDEVVYLTTLLTDFMNKFDGALHVAEFDLYKNEGQALRVAKDASENTTLDRDAVYGAQLGLLDAALDRLEGALSGARFTGTAVGSDSQVRKGQFVMLGPAVVFRSDDGSAVGTAEQRIDSEEPAVVGFELPEDAQAADMLVVAGRGGFPLDPTLGNAHKMAATEITLMEEVEKGGFVMYPIFGMAAIALLVALIKWISLAFIRKPPQARIDALLGAVGRHDQKAADEKVAAIGGPVGRMLKAGVEHLKEPRELIEEVMYETVLTTRLKLDRMLPFIAICAASAPLLGLLGTVTGIINTFKLITVFGSGDVKSLSGGISEALITTKFGLIVAIPSLLMHAFLSRKVRGVLGQMETAAISFVNQVSRSQRGTGGDGAPVVPDSLSARPAAGSGDPEPDADLVGAGQA